LRSLRWAGIVKTVHPIYSHIDRRKTEMTVTKEALLTTLRQQPFVKMIAGIDNVDLNRVSMVVKAATQAGCQAVDVAATSAVVQCARQLTTLPVFASSVEPQALADAILAGADVAEIGNFDALYKNGFYLTAEDVIRLTEETLALLPEGTPLSVTVPGHLTVETQVRLAQHLEQLGVALIQTEGASRVVSTTKTVEVLSAADRFALTLENTEAIAQAVNIPVMTASGITVENAAQPFSVGATAIGVGSSISTLAAEEAMTEALSALVTHVAESTKTVAVA
jgi:hypothetical protein